MGVRGLWEVARPVARPVTLESLRKKRLAVDASIWIYQFLKAVRDGQGNVVRNAHIIGFFRRLCKLLYFDIRPVFVFDGGAPSLKKTTINRRRERRMGRAADASHTAARLLTVQLQRMASQGKEKRERTEKPLGEIPENAVYYDERNTNEGNDRKEKKPFRPQDQYHLPEAEIVQPDVNDPRMLTEEELSQYAAEFGSQLSSGLLDVGVPFELGRGVYY
jgi:DNA excision repair protein ERCC-5